MLSQFLFLCMRINHHSQLDCTHSHGGDWDVTLSTSLGHFWMIKWGDRVHLNKGGTTNGLQALKWLIGGKQKSGVVLASFSFRVPSWYGMLCSTTSSSSLWIDALETLSSNVSFFCQVVSVKNLFIVIERHYFFLKNNIICLPSFTSNSLVCLFFPMCHWFY